MQYTTILHNVRKRFKITCNEYCVVDLILFRQNDPKTKKHGWCTLSRQDMADELDFSRQTIITILNKVKEMGLIEEDDTFYLRVTPLWYDAISKPAKQDAESQESVQGVKKLYTPNASENEGCKESVQGVKNLDRVSNNLTGNRKETLQQGVKTFDTPPYIEENKEIINTSSSSAREENFENLNNAGYEQSSRDKKNNPPQSSGKVPPYDWNNLYDVLLADEPYVKFVCHTLKFKNGLKDDIEKFKSLVLDYVIQEHGLHHRINPDYEDLKKHIVYLGRKQAQNSNNDGNNSTKNNFRNKNAGGANAVFDRDDDDYR